MWIFGVYSLFDLSKIFVYSAKVELLCVAKCVLKVHPMANVLGMVKDMEEYKQQYKKQQQTPTILTLSPIAHLYYKAKYSFWQLFLKDQNTPSIATPKLNIPSFFVSFIL